MTAQKGEREEALELVARLRNDGSSWAQDLFNEAADTIERLLSSSKAEGEMREALAEDFGMIEHSGRLLMVPNPADERHCFSCTSRSACRNRGVCGLGWHNTSDLRAALKEPK